MQVLLAPKFFTKKYDVADGASEITASDLTASTGYMLDLTYTGSDFALDSGNQEFTTTEAVPIDYFGEVFPSDVSYDCFTVNFTPNQAVNGAYNLYYRLSGATIPWTILSINPGVSKYTITKLDDDTVYEYFVQFQVNDTDERSSIATQLTTHLFKAPKAPELILNKTNIKADSVTITGIPPTKDYEEVPYITDDPITYRLYYGYYGTTILATNSTPDFTVYLKDYPHMSSSQEPFKVVPVRNGYEGKPSFFSAQVPFTSKIVKYRFMLETMGNRIEDANSKGKLDTCSVADKEYYLKLVDDVDTMVNSFMNTTTYQDKTEAEIQAIVDAGFVTTGKSLSDGFSDAMTLLVPLNILDQVQEYTIWVNDLSPLITR